MRYEHICGLFVPDNLIKSNCSKCDFCMNNTQNRVCDIAESGLMYPILVNWNIIGTCINRCKYCYGENIFESSYVVEKREIDVIISNIKKMQPEVVVVTGGEPLLHPEFFYIIDKLSKCTNVIVDTNGILIKDEHIKFLKKHNIHIRVSLDDHREIINGKIRVSKCTNSTEIILHNLEELLNNDNSVTVQTVLSPFNSKYITEFGEYLLEKNVKYWRIHRLVPQSLFDSQDNRDWMNESCNRIKIFAQNHLDKMIIRISNEGSQGNSLINIDPTGIVNTRPSNSLNREIIGNLNCDNPDIDSIFNKINKAAHLNRYFKEYAISSP